MTRRSLNSIVDLLIRLTIQATPSPLSKTVYRRATAPSRVSTTRSRGFPTSPTSSRVATMPTSRVSSRLRSTAFPIQRGCLAGKIFTPTILVPERKHRASTGLLPKPPEASTGHSQLPMVLSNLPNSSPSTVHSQMSTSSLGYMLTYSAEARKRLDLRAGSITCRLAIRAALCTRARWCWWASRKARRISQNRRAG
jgi:hypothetical protein